MSEKTEQEKNVEQVQQIMKLSNLIKALNITMEKTGDVEILFGYPEEINGLVKMNYDLPDFIVPEPGVLILTGQTTVDKLLAQQQKLQQEEAKRTFVDENGNQIVK